MGASLAGAAFSIAGGLLVNAIAPPNKPKQEALSGAGALSSSPTYAITGARNNARPFGVVKRVLGQHKVSPDHGAQPFTELVGRDEYLRMLLVWGIGPLKVEDRKIGETDLDAFDDVETEFRRGYQAGQLADQGAWDPSGGTYPSPAAFGDLYTASGPGTVDGVAYLAGDTIVFNGLAADTSSDAWDRNGDQPLTLFSNSVHEEPLNVALTFAGGPEIRTTQAAVDEISIDVAFPSGLMKFNAAGDRLRTTVAIKVEYRPVSGGAWTEAATITVTDFGASVIRAGRRWTVARDQYEVRLTRLTADSASEKIIDGSTWTTLRSISTEYPIACEVGLCVEAIRIKATGQLTGIVDQLSGVATAIVPDWDADSETWITRATRNNASLFRAVCQDAGQARPQADAAIDLAGLQAWHATCEARAYRFDAVIDFAVSTRELLADIASAGGGAVARPGGLWGVVVDAPGDVVQVFSPRNSWGFRGHKTFVDLPHALRMRFVNRDNDWQDDERLVYRDGYGPSNATQFEGLEQFGVTDPDAIWRRGREHLASAVLRPERYSLVTDVAWLVANRGDGIRVGHDVFLVGLGSGRIKTVTDDGTFATSATVDELLEMETARSYGLRVQHVADDGSVVTDLVAIDTDDTEGGVHDVTFSTPIALADAPAAGDVFLFGEVGLESMEGVVVAIRPRSDLSAEIVFVDAAPEVNEAAIASRAIAAADVSAAADTFTSTAHPFQDGDVGQMLTTGTLPDPLAEATDYFVVSRTADTFKLAAASGGAAIDLTDAGSGTHTFTRRIPDFSSSVSAPFSLGAPSVVSARSDGTVLFREPDGSLTSRILVTLARPSGLQTDIVAVEARWRPVDSDGGPWSTARAGRDDGEISLKPVVDGAAFTYQLRWVLKDGTPGQWNTPASHTVEGKSADPSDVTGFSAQQNGGVVTFRWNQIPDLDRAGYELRYAALGAFDWDAATGITRETKGTLVTNAGLPPGSWTVGIKALDTSGNYSANAATFDIVVTNQNEVVATQAFEPYWRDVRLPAIYTFDFMAGELPPGASLSRASSGYDGSYFDRTGLLRDAAAGAPRFTFDPVTLALEGLLNEDQRTSGLIASEDLSNATWGKSGLTVLANQGASPRGDTGADRITATGALGPFTSQSFTTTSGLYYTARAVLEYENNPWVALRFAGASGFATVPFAWFDIQNGVVGTRGSGIAHHDIRALGGGRYLISATAQATGSGSANIRFYLVTGDNLVGTPVAGQKALVWGLGFERSAPDLGSYIYTGAAAATRAADVLPLSRPSGSDLPDGTYDVVITRLDGEEVLSDVAVSGGSYTVPTSVSPLQAVWMIRYAEGTTEAEKAALIAARPQTVEEARPILTGFVRHDVSGRLVPASQDTDATADDVFDSFVPRPVEICTLRAPEIDVGHQSSGLRVWATFTVEPGPGEAAVPDVATALDYRTDAGSYDGFEPWTVGTIEARYLQWQLELVPTEVVAHVSAFGTVVDQVERSERHTGLAIAPGGTTLTYDEAFFNLPHVQATAEAVSGAARFAVWADKTETTVKLFVFDGANTDVGGSLDVTITGA